MYRYILEEKLKIVSLFDRSGEVVKSFYELGYDVLTIDIKPAKHNFPSLQADIKNINPIPSDVVFAFPPCTHLSRAGAQFWKAKYKKNPKIFIDSFKLVQISKIWCMSSKYWLIENPVGKINQFWRYPNWAFHPYEYAGYLPKKDQYKEAYTKKTCIWSNFFKPKTKPIEPIYTNFFKSSFSRAQSAQAKYDRSKTPKGFSKAIFEHLKNKALYQPTLFNMVI